MALERGQSTDAMVQKTNEYPDNSYSNAMAMPRHGLVDVCSPTSHDHSSDIMSPDPL